MATRVNPITIYLHEQRYITLSGWARKHKLSPTSVRNTIYGIRPIKKVVNTMYKEDMEIFNLLPADSKLLLQQQAS